jgi:hypothetical protein
MMKALIDMPVSPLLLEVLQAYGHQGVHAHQIGNRLTQLPIEQKKS